MRVNSSQDQQLTVSIDGITVNILMPCYYKEGIIGTESRNLYYRAIVICRDDLDELKQCLTFLVSEFHCFELLL